MEDIIEVKNVSKSFGGVKANIDISLKVKKGFNYRHYWTKWLR